jgi:hypothetical protein
MTPDVDQLLTPDEDPVVIKNGRYQIPDPTTGKTRLWTRASTLADTLEDKYNLTKWQLRRAAIGVAATPSIQAAILSTPDDDTYETKRELDKLVEQAQEKAKAGEKRDLGTALHKILERVDRGDLDHTTLPEPWLGDVQAWRHEARRKQLTGNPHLLEVCVVNPTLGVAGRLDLILTDHEGQLVVADRKTGGFISWLKFAMQFAVYVTATHTWDGTTLAPMPPVRQDHALLIHQPAGSGVCRLWKMDVAVGYEACLMALEVRRQRAAKSHDIGKPYDVPGDTEPELVASIPPPSTGELALWLRSRVDNLKTNHPDAARALAARWPADVPTFKHADTHTASELAQIEAAIDRVEAAHQIPFGPPRPGGKQQTTNTKKAEAA